MKPSGLPIDDALPALRAALAAHASAVLHAPPGAGKSTVVPLALLEEPWIEGRRIVMLEPRRLAARAVARRMAETLGEEVGARIGWRMRLDTRVSRATRIEVVTEGVLTRMLQEDPALDGVALLIFDEFHERSLQADLGLAMALDARDALTPELRILVMSATLDVEPVAKLLGDAAVVEAAGRAFPVETRWAGAGAPPLPDSPGRRTGTPRPGGAAGRGGPPSAEIVAARLVERALRETQGDVLVFLPGVREIRRVQALLDDTVPPANVGAGADRSAAEPIGPARPIGRPSDASAAVRIVPLYGDLDAAAQDAALAPGSAGDRKVVLATNIAETSLTIEGVRVVVDSGLVRRSIFDPATGMSRLETQRISRASAEQRQGRAGRTAPGVCYRAWSEAAHRGLAPATPPEIVAADLAPLALELASWGTSDAGALRWLDPPPAAMLASARDLLKRLDALDEAGRITRHGRDMARLAVHPRLAHMLLRARLLHAVPLAARLAALLSERDLLRGAASRRADINERVAVLHGATAGQDVDKGGLQRVRRLAVELERAVGRSAAERSAIGRAAAGRSASERSDGEPTGHEHLAAVLLALAYPDRIGRRRPGGAPRYALSNGRGAMLDEAQSLAREEFIVAVDVDDRERDARIRLAAPLTREAIETHFAEELDESDDVEWDPREQAVVARRALRLGRLVIDEKPLPQVPAAAAGAAMLHGVQQLGLDALPWTEEARDLQARAEFLRSLGIDEAADWPAMDDAALADTLDEWLAPWLEGMTRREHLGRLPLTDALKARLGWQRLAPLDELAPPRLAVPSGSRIRIDYRDDSAPVVAVRLQEVFGLDETPRIASGRAPVTFKLLSPARRPVQVTRDLASFWRGAYADVRKDLRGRYPKHYWPENPLEAEPTRGVRRR